MQGFPSGPRGLELPASTGDIRDAGSIPESERFPGGGYGNPCQYSRQENPMDKRRLVSYGIGSQRVEHN